MTYYLLYCETCQEECKPVRGTAPGELLHPDYEAAEDAGYSTASDALRQLHKDHATHNLIEKEEEGDDCSTLLSSY